MFVINKCVAVLVCCTIDFRGVPLRNKWDLIPAETDILITHGPPLGAYTTEICVDVYLLSDSGLVVQNQYTIDAQTFSSLHALFFVFFFFAS